MRIWPFFLVIAACSPESPPPAPDRALYAGRGRDRLCVEGDRAGFVTYGAGDANCSARGRIERAGAAASFRPDGEEDCRILLTFSGDRATLGPGQLSCSYYCGPGATLGGKSFSKDASASPAVDFAGDPLC
jgi:hypothetical protein